MLTPRKDPTLGIYKTVTVLSLTITKLRCIEVNLVPYSTVIFLNLRVEDEPEYELIFTIPLGFNNPESLRGATKRSLFILN